MHVHFYATLRQVTGCKTVDFGMAPGTTVRQLMAEVVERYPPLKEELFREDGELFPHVHVFVNGRDAPFLDGGLDTVLQEDDTLDVFPAVAGG